MKKFILIIAIVLGITASANAQIKTEGFKLIGSLGLGTSWETVGAGGESMSGYGTIDPQVEITAGANVISNIYLGAGIGYVSRCGVKDVEDTFHELKVLGHVRFYATPENNSSFIVDVKGGYSRMFANGSGLNGGNVFVGPGYMFNRKCAISLGYDGSFFKFYGISTNYHGIAAKFTMEF